MAFLRTGQMSDQPKCGTIVTPPSNLTCFRGGTTMERKEVPLTLEQLAPFDLDAFIHKATELNQRHARTFTTPFPKAPSRWRSHYHFTPRPIALTTRARSKVASVGSLVPRSTCA